MAHPMEAARSSRSRSPRVLTVASALLILSGGYVHLCLYRHGYRFIPKVGVGFLLQFGSSVIVAGALPIWARSARPRRHGVNVAQLMRLAAIGLSVGTLAALGIAHTSGGLLNFREIGLTPAPQTLIAIVVESIATVLLVVAVWQARTAVPGEDVTAIPSRETIRDAA